MKLVYVAGKFRGPTPLEIHMNVCQAERAGAVVAALGFMPVIPHKNTENFHASLGLPDSFWLEGTLEMLRRCDAVYVFEPNHVINSQGTRGEADEALRLGIPVLLGFPDLVAWAENLQGAARATAT